MAVAAPINWSSGCSHYKRFCKLVTPCCNNIYTCRFCHDEKEDHVLNRTNVKQLICVVCATMQPLQVRCEECRVVFGKYACLTCKLFDNDNKDQFHCKDCGICRIGGKHNYFHCKKCNLCLALRLLNNHKCLKDASHNNCPVCIEDIHTSRIAAHVPICGHLIHQTCFDTLQKAGRTTCPLCQADY